MAYFGRDGDIITIDNDKIGSLTHSLPLYEFTSTGDPADLWRTQPAIRTVTGAIARNISSIPLHVYERTSDTDRRRVTDTAVARMLRTPAAYTGAARFFEQLMLDMAVHDRWACFIQTSDAGGLELVRVPPWRVQVVENAGRRVALAILTGGEETLVPLDRVVFDVAPSASPRGDRDAGDPRAMTLAGLADELDTSGQWRRDVLRNGARVPAVIERPTDAPKWDDASFNRFKADWDNFTAGGGQAGGTPLLEDGMSLRKVEVFNPKDFDTADIRRLTLIEAAILWHYPPELLGAREGTYSNIESFREQLYVDVLGPWVANLEQSLNVGLADWLADGEYIEANVDAKLRGAFEDRSRVFQTSVGAPIMTRNEARARMNLPAIEGGDEVVTPLNVMLGGLASPTDTNGDNAGGGGQAPAGGETEQVVAGGFTADELLQLINAAAALIRSGFDPAESLELVGLDPIDHLGLLPVTLQRPTQPEEGEADEELYEEIRKAVTTWAGGSGKAEGRGRKASRPDDLGNADAERRALEVRMGEFWQAMAGRIENYVATQKAVPDLSGALNLPAEVAALEPIIRAHMLRLAEVGAWDVLEAWNPDSDGWGPDQIQAWIARAAQTNAEAWCHSIDQRLIETGADPDNFTQRLADLLTSEGMVVAFAAAFAAEALGFGGTDAARASGLGTKTWITTSGNPRVSHAAQHGETVPIDDIFSNGLRWPGDHFGDPGETVNCSCRLEYGRN